MIEPSDSDAVAPAASARALEGIRVLDLSCFLSGPTATLFLAGLGADVIKVERPVVGDPARHNPPYWGTNGCNFGAPAGDDISLSVLKRARQKRGITIDLKTDEGRRLFLDLVRRSDVVVENFVPGTLDRLKLGSDILLHEKPGLIVCSISGFGQDGPYRDFAAFDLVVQAMSGLMSVTGDHGGPPLRTGAAVADVLAGVVAVAGILAALRHRDRTGHGQTIDVSMLDCLFAMVMDEAIDVYERSDIPVRTGNRRTRLTPFNCYRTSDGYVAIATGSDGHWVALLRAMDRDDLVEKGYFRSLEERMAKAEHVDEFIEAWTRELSTEVVAERMRAFGVSCGAVRSVTELMTDPQLLSRGMIADLVHPTAGRLDGVQAANLPIRLSVTDTALERAAPRLGEHNEEVLRELLDLEESEIQDLAATGVI